MMRAKKIFNIEKVKKISRIILTCTIFLILNACEEQDIISNIRSLNGYGFIEAKVFNSKDEISTGLINNLEIKSSNYLTIELVNTGGLDVTNLRLPKSLPPPLFYEQSDNAHSKLDSLDSVTFMDSFDERFSPEGREDIGDESLNKTQAIELNPNLPIHLVKKCSSLKVKRNDAELDNDHRCSFRIYFYSDTPTTFKHTLQITYNDGINDQKITINIGGEISAPGDIYYSINEMNSFDDYINDWRSNAIKQKTEYVSMCNGSILESPYFNRGIYEQHEPNLNFTQNGPLAFGLTENKKIYLFNYGAEEIQILKSSFTHSTLVTNNEANENIYGIPKCDLIDYEKNKIFPPPVDESNGAPFFSFSGNYFPGIRGDCETVIKPNTVCSIEISYSPKELKNDGGDTHKGVMTLHYNDKFEKDTDYNSRKKFIQIHLSGAAKKDRANIIIKNIGVPFDSSTCEGSSRQGCNYLGNVPIGKTIPFNIELENTGIMPAEILQPKLKIEQFGLNDEFYEISDDKNNYIQWMGHDFIPESNNQNPPCSTFLNASETCSMHFNLNTNGFLNPTDFTGKVSKLLSFPYNNRDVVSPEVLNARVKNPLILDEYKDRVNISIDVVPPGNLSISDLFINDSESIFGIEGFVFSDYVSYTFPIQETSSRSEEKLTISFENTGDYESTQIEILEIGDGSSNITIDRASCPGTLEPNSQKKCQINVTANSSDPGSYEKKFKLTYFNGVEFKESKVFEIYASFANTSKLTSKVFIEEEDEEDGFKLLNGYNNQFIFDLPTPKFKIEIINSGKSEAKISNFQILEALNCSAFETPLTIENLDISSCETEPIAGKILENNKCEIFFNLAFNSVDISEKSITNPIIEECELNYKFNYEDEYSKLISQDMTEDEIKEQWLIEASSGLKLGQGPSIILLSHDEYISYLELTEPNDKFDFLSTTSQIIANFGKNQKSTNDISNQISEIIIALNIGGTTAKNVAYETSLPEVFQLQGNPCSQINSLAACILTINFNSFENKVFEEELKYTFFNGYTDSTDTYTIIAESGEYGLLRAYGGLQSNVEDNVTIDFGEYIIGTTQKLTVYLKNFGEDNLKITKISDNTIIESENGGISEDEDQKRLETSSCLTMDQDLTSEQICTLEYEVLITSENPKTISISADYMNLAEPKKYQITIRYQGITPPFIKAEFTGDDSPNQYFYKEVPKLTFKEKAFFFRNTGNTNASDFKVELAPNSHESFSISYDTCDFLDQTLDSGDSCEIRIKYAPMIESEIITNEEDGSETLIPHEGSILVHYDPIIEPETPLPLQVGLLGTSIIPSSSFVSYKDIKVVNKDDITNITFSWDSFTKPDENIEIDSYNIYFSEDVPLPKVMSGIAPIETIESNAVADRIFETSLQLSPGKQIYYSIRPLYLGQELVIDKTESLVNPWDLKIIIPPPNMALVHPFIANEITCTEMRYRPDFENEVSEELQLYAQNPLPPPSTRNFSCPSEKIEVESDIESNLQYDYLYYNFDEFLFVDLYELTINQNTGIGESVEGQIPSEFVVPISAKTACENITELMQDNIMNKRLLTRQEWFVSASWSNGLSSSKIDKIETNFSSDDCNHNLIGTYSNTGERKNCVSRFGIYDMIGNMWEWNSNQINVIIGLGEQLGENFLIPGSNAISFPSETPCYSYIHGLAYLPKIIDDKEVCYKSIKGNLINQTTASYYFPPNPMNKTIKNIRSGGGVGEKIGATSSSIKRTGRHVVDLDSSTGTYTGARCGFSIPYSND